MGLYICGMEMPEDRDITIRIAPNGDVFVYGRYPTELHNAVSVPAHGRLIDADKMLADNEIYYNQLGRPDGVIGSRYRSVKRSIEIATTIISPTPSQANTDVTFRDGDVQN